VVPRHVIERDEGHSPAFPDRQSLGSGPEFVPGSHLHFDEDKRLAVARDDVQFSTASSVSARDNCVPSPFELTARQIFTGFAERDARPAHCGAGKRKNAATRTSN
jgi:hypothetical protein